MIRHRSLSWTRSRRWQADMPLRHRGEAGCEFNQAVSEVVDWKIAPRVYPANKGPALDNVSLQWVGGSPPYKAYRATAPLAVVQPGNSLGTTSGSTWIDFGAVVLSGGCLFYVVISSPPMCGDGLIDVGEVCDDGILSNGDGCDGSCIVEQGYLCSGQPSLCVPTECNDAIDSDGDAHTGYPNDPGCTDINDHTETDDCPSGPGCPQCADLLDNDGDSFLDYPSDPGCSAAGDVTE